MGCFDLYCFICGNSCYDVDFNELENIDISKQEKNNINKSIKWLKKCTVLLANNKVIHDCFDSNCSGVFSLKKKKKSNSTELFDCTGNKNKFTTTIHEPVIISITTKEQNSINNTILSISFIVEDGYRWHASSFTLLTEYEY